MIAGRHKRAVTEVPVDLSELDLPTVLDDVTETDDVAPPAALPEWQITLSATVCQYPSSHRSAVVYAYTAWGPPDGLAYLGQDEGFATVESACQAAIDFLTCKRQAAQFGTPRISYDDLLRGVIPQPTQQA